MLCELAVQNLAIIEDVRVELRPGFCAWTGETGAGKSLLLGAVGLLLGERAAAESVRALRRRFAELSAAREQRQRELALLRFEREELDRAELVPGEVAALTRERDRLTNAQGLQSFSADGYALLYGDEGSVVERLGKLLHEAADWTKLDPELEEIVRRLETLNADVQDVAATL